MTDEMNRRDFLSLSTAVGIGLGLGMPASVQASLKRVNPDYGVGFAAEAIPNVRIGFVGVGGMGTNHVANLLRIQGCELRAVCDIVPERVAQVQKMAKEQGRVCPEGYTRGETDFKRLCERDDLDLVYTATPWHLHVPVCLTAMQNGKHAATEIPMALTLKDCWKMIETAERTRRHCVMMENCCYDRVEMMILNMVRQGVLGEMLHAECGYLHDLRELKFATYGEGLWRREHSIKRNGDLYPTHGLGPVAQCMDINRGDAFDHLVSMGSQSICLKEYALKHFEADDPRHNETYKLSDVVTTMIRTKKGRTIMVWHDTNTPRPYSRNILVQGTRGLFCKYPESLVHIEGRSPAHVWEAGDKYLDEFDHPLWKALAAQAKDAGHGGMDFIEDFRLIECLRKGEPTDLNVYDGAAWSAVCELSERSIEQGSNPQAFPDFTRGQWRANPPLSIIRG